MKVSEELLYKRMYACRNMTKLLMLWTKEYEKVKEFNQTERSAYEEEALEPILKLTRRYEEAVGEVINGGILDMLEEAAKMQAQGYPKGIATKAQGGS